MPRVGGEEDVVVDELWPFHAGREGPDARRKAAGL